MKVDRPWHPKAREMRAQGVNYGQIGKACGVARDTVIRLFDQEYCAKRDAANRVRLARKIQTDPAYRARYHEVRRAQSKTKRIRQAARIEAAETGKPVDEVFAAWGVSYVR